VVLVTEEVDIPVAVGDLGALLFLVTGVTDVVTVLGTVNGPVVIEA
jgi:hypothetical protein